MTIGLSATAQTVTDEVDIESNGDVKLEMINPAEPVNESKQEIKEREKRLREHNDEVAYAKASNSMRRGYFVLLADYIQLGRSGYRYCAISGNTNFILVQEADGIFQYALNTGKPGVNGLGGSTCSGTVSNKRIKVKDNGDVFMQFHFVGKWINTEIDITLFHNTNQAVAHIHGTNITMYGEIRPYRDSDHR